VTSARTLRWPTERRMCTLGGCAGGSTAGLSGHSNREPLDACCGRSGLGDGVEGDVGD